MNKLYIFLLTLISTFYISCDDKVCNFISDEDIYGIPNVIKGSFPESTLTPALGDVIEFAPKLKNNQNVTYLWTVNGVEVSTDSIYNYTVDTPSRLNLICEIKNDLGKAILKSEIISKQDFTKGFIFVDSKEIGFYDATTQNAYYDIFKPLNYGTSLTTSGDVLAMQINDKLCFMIKNSTTNLDHIVIANANTLQKTNSILGAANLIGFIPLNERYALITGLREVYRLDLTKNEFVKLASDKSIFSGTVFNGKLITCSTYSSQESVYMYDLDAIISASEGEMLTSQRIDITQTKKSLFGVAKDGNLYTTGEEDGIAKLYKVKSDFTIESIDLPFALPKPSWSELYFNGVVVSEKENAIFIPADNGSIYKYIIDDSTSLNQAFIVAPSGDSVVLYGAGIQEDPITEELYTFYATKEYYSYKDGKIIIRNSDGTEKQTIEKDAATPKAAIFVK